MFEVKPRQHSLFDVRSW